MTAPQTAVMHFGVLFLSYIRSDNIYQIFLVLPIFGVIVFIIGRNLLANFFRRKPTKPPMSFCKPSAYCIMQDMSFREQALFRPYLPLYKESLRSSCKPTSGDKHKKHREPRLCNKQIKQNVKIAAFFCLL